jgi:hypothetical protein
MVFTRGRERGNQDDSEPRQEVAGSRRGRQTVRRSSSRATESPAGGNNYDIYIMNPNGSSQSPLVTHGATDEFPDW